jgi:hypothetical protein
MVNLSSQDVVLLVAIAILVSFIGGWYMGVHRHVLWLKLLHNLRDRTNGRYQERIRKAEERINRTKI